MQVKFCLEENRSSSRKMKVWTIISFHHLTWDSSSHHCCYYSFGLVVVFWGGGGDAGDGNDNTSENPTGYAIIPTAELMPKAWNARKAILMPRPAIRLHFTGLCLDYFHFNFNTDRKF